MKLIKISIITCVASFFAISCSRDLLETSPKADKEVSNFYRTAEEIEQAVNGAYSTLQLQGQYKISNLVLGELASDNTYDEVPANDNGYYGQFDLMSLTPSNSLIENHWRDHYIGIQQCNIILNRINSINMKDDIKNSRKGESLFLRALMYFNLVQAYGDVPLALDETTNVNEYFGQGRTEKSKVYEQIEKDLQEAINLLPAKQSDKGRASKGAAYGLLGRVLLTEKKYSDALSTLKKTENLGYELLPNLADIFSITNKNNNEILFSVQFAAAIDGNSQSSNTFQMFSPSGSVSGAKGHNLPSKELYNFYSNNDLRKKEYVGITKSGVPYSQKFKKPNGDVAYGTSNVVVLRYADVILMMAECNAELGNLQEAVTYLNKTRLRAGIEYFTSTDKNSILNEIEKERRREFVGEGLRWYDLVRTGKAIGVMTEYFKNTAGYSGVTIDQNKLVFPIPQSQINTDSAIKQNIGY